MRLDERDAPYDGGHISALLARYTRGDLGATDAARVRAHLRACAACRDELALRDAVSRRTHAEMAAMAAPSLALLDRVWAEAERPAVPQSRAPLTAALGAQVARGWALTRMQAKLLPRGVWIIAPAAMLLAVATALAWHGHTYPPLVLGFFVTTATAGGAALLYGPEGDPSLELALATPTRPHVVLLSRFVLALCYNVALALGATLLLSAVRSGGFAQLAASWLGPTLLLSGLSLLLSVRRGSMAGIAAIAGLWCLRLILLLALPPAQTGASLWSLLGAIWQTTPITLAAAALLCVAAILATPREVRAA